MMTKHRKTLLMNIIRVALNSLRSLGVGYIDIEHTDEIHYKIDDKVFVITVKDGDTNG